MDIKVSYSLDLDVWNYLRSVYKFVWYKHGRDNLQDKFFSALPERVRIDLKNSKSEKQARNIIKDFLSQNLESRKAKYSVVAQELKSAWVKNGSQIENRLQKIYGRKIPFKQIKIYLSSLPICPYNFEKKWIMVFGGAIPERQLQILTHELNHFMFYYYFGNLKKELGKEKFESLKEALTVFTNPEEKGYPAQQKLRAWLVKQKKSIPEIIQDNKWRDYL